MRPYAEGGRREILAQPKVYGFDTGFVCFARGWEELRPEDCGLLWEHLVLDTLLTIPVRRLHFWRDKQQREVDFVIPCGRDAVDVIECKWNLDALDTRGVAAFRASYPKGRNYVVTPSAVEPFPRSIGTFTWAVTPIGYLRQAVAKMG